MNQEAKQMVLDAERSIIPKGASIPFGEVISAEFERKGVAVATVRMFDGTQAVIEAGHVGNGQWGLSWRVHWRDLGGAPISWNAQECRWVRDPAR